MGMVFCFYFEEFMSLFLATASFSSRYFLTLMKSPLKLFFEEIKRLSSLCP